MKQHPLAPAPRSRPGRDAGDEAGFTLVELLVVIVILPLVLGALGVVLVTTLIDQTGANTRISSSSDAQNTSAIYVRDVQGATYLTTDGAPPSTPGGTTSAPAVCGTSQAGYGYVLGVAWSSQVPSGFATGTAINSVVSYWVEGIVHVSDGSAAGLNLTSVSAGFTPADVGMGIVETDSQGVVPTGTTIAAVNSSTSVTLSQAATGSATGVSFVVGPKLVRSYCAGNLSPTTSIVSHDFASSQPWATITCSPSATTSQCAASNFALGWFSAVGVSSVTLPTVTSGSKYTYSLTAAPYTPEGPGFTGFPTGGTAPPFLMLGTGTVINQSNGTISINGSAIINSGKISSNGTFTAGSVQTSNPNGSGDTCSSPNCTPPTSQWTYGAAPVADPLANLPDPAEPTTQITTCPNLGSGTVALSPGEYTCQLKINGANVIMSSGLYVFDQGVSISSGALDGTQGVIVYFPCNTVDTWAPTCNEGFSQSNGTLNMNPLGGTGPYQDLWFWQNPGDTAQVTLDGPSAATALNGTLYAPSAQVKITGGAVS